MKLENIVWYSWKNGHLSSGITTSWPANQSDAKLLEGGIYSKSKAWSMSYITQCAAVFSIVLYWTIEYRNFLQVFPTEFHL